MPGLVVMRDVAIAKSEFVPGERAVTKIQDFQYDDVLFDYCCLPEVCSFVCDSMFMCKSAAAKKILFCSLRSMSLLTSKNTIDFIIVILLG